MQTAQHRAHLQSVRLAPTARITPRTLIGSRPRVIEALIWLVRILFVQPIGHRAREERLGALPDRILRDIGLGRADVHAAAGGMVPLRETLRPYPSAGPLYVCGRPGYPLTLVRLSKAA